MDLRFEDEYVDHLGVNVANRTFYLYGSDGSNETIKCETVDQFMGVLDFAKQSIAERITYVTD
jgi:hypothetical protein